MAADWAQYSAQHAPQLSPDILKFGIAVVSPTFNDDAVQSWVNAIISENQLPKSSSCIVILNPRGALNTDADKGVLGYHDKADAPYIFVNIGGNTTLTVQDLGND